MNTLLANIATVLDISPASKLVVDSGTSWCSPYGQPDPVALLCPDY